MTFEICNQCPDLRALHNRDDGDTRTACSVCECDDFEEAGARMTDTLTLIVVAVFLAAVAVAVIAAFRQRGER